MERMDCCEIEYTINVVVSCVVLHNLCELNGDPKWMVADISQADASPSSSASTRRFTSSAIELRTTFTQYLSQQ